MFDNIYSCFTLLFANISVSTPCSFSWTPNFCKQKVSVFLKCGANLCWRRWGCCWSPRWPSSGEAVWCWKVRQWRVEFPSAWQTYSHLCTHKQNVMGKKNTILQYAHYKQPIASQKRKTRKEEGGQQASSFGLYHLHRPDVHFGSILPVSEQLRGSVGWTSTLGVEELQRQRFSLQSVTQAKICVKHHRFNNGTHVQMDWMAKTGSITMIFQQSTSVSEMSPRAGMPTYLLSLCCYDHPAGSFQSLNLYKEKQEEEEERELLGHKGRMWIPVELWWVNPTRISQVPFFPYRWMFWSNFIDRHYGAWSIKEPLLTPCVWPFLCIFMDNQLRWDQKGCTEAKENSKLNLGLGRVQAWKNTGEKKK